MCVCVCVCACVCDGFALSNPYQRTSGIQDESAATCLFSADKRHSARAGLTRNTPTNQRGRCCPETHPTSTRTVRGRCRSQSSRRQNTSAQNTARCSHGQNHSKSSDDGPECTCKHPAARQLFLGPSRPGRYHSGHAFAAEGADNVFTHGTPWTGKFHER